MVETEFGCLTLISGAIHWKTKRLKKEALYSLETSLVSGTGGGGLHLKGFNCLYQGLGRRSAAASTSLDKALAVVAWDLGCSSAGFLLAMLGVVIVSSRASRLAE